MKDHVYEVIIEFEPQRKTLAVSAATNQEACEKAKKHFEKTVASKSTVQSLRSMGEVINGH